MPTTNTKPSRMDSKESQAAACVGGMGFFLLCLGVLVVCFSGCVAASKKARTVHEIFDYQICQPQPGKFLALLTHHELWRDEYKGGGRAFLADPRASELASGHTNQSALGGSSSLSIGAIESTVNTNAVKTISDAVSQTVSEVVSKMIVPKP